MRPLRTLATLSAAGAVIALGALIAPAAASADTPIPVPTIMSPVDGTIVSGQQLTISATVEDPDQDSHPDGVVVFRDQSGDLETSSVYGGQASVTLDLAAVFGTRVAETLSAQYCPPGYPEQGECGADSAPVHITRIIPLHPSISVSPSVFRTSTKVAYRLPDTETGTLRFIRGGHIYRTVALGTHRAGTYSWTWNGTSNGTTHVPDGTYTAQLSTTATRSGVVLHGIASKTVRLDRTAPRFSSVTGNHATFYPYHDGYRDTFAPHFTLNEAGWVTLTVRDPHGHTLRVLKGYRHAGRTSVGWSGYTASGHRFAGTFYWYLSSQDSVGNHRTIGHYVGYASTKRLIGHTASYTKAGAGDFSAGGSADYCAGASKSASSFPTGIWLLNICDPDPYFGDGFQIAASFYHFSLPRAVKYGSMSTSVVGYTEHAPSEIYSGFRKTNGDYDGFKAASVYSTNPNGTTYHLGSAAVAGHSTPITVGIALDDAYNSGGYTSDFDLKSVRLTVRYYTLG
jgi:hypothetical protein